MCDYLKVSYNGTVVQVPLIYRVTVFMSTSGEGKTYFIDSSIESFVDYSEDKVLTVECEKKLLFFLIKAISKRSQKYMKSTKMSIMLWTRSSLDISLKLLKTPMISL